VIKLASLHILWFPKNVELKFHCDILIIFSGLTKSMKLGTILVLKFGEEAFDDQGIIFWRDMEFKSVIYNLNLARKLNKK